MAKWRLAACMTALSALFLSCNTADRDHARERADHAGEKAREDAHKLGQEARQDFRKLDQNIQHAVNGTGSAGAREKLRRGGEELKAATGQAAVKLDHAAMVAKVKTKLASDLGVQTVTNVRDRKSVV